MKIKYLASYHGPSYRPVDQEYMDGLQNLWSAMKSMRNRQSGWAPVDTFKEDSEGTYRLHRRGMAAFSATTYEDYMDVYYALPEEGGYILGEWAYRISVGPRGGIRTNKA